MQSKDGPQTRSQEIEKINAQFDEVIDRIIDPDKHKRTMEQIMSNPMLAAGERALERAKWDMIGQRAAADAAKLREQGF